MTEKLRLRLCNISLFFFAYFSYLIIAIRKGGKKYVDIDVVIGDFYWNLYYGGNFNGGFSGITISTDRYIVGTSGHCCYEMYFWKKEKKLSQKATETWPFGFCKKEGMKWNS